MADNKQGEGFFRKVVRFVANPATDWAELNTKQEDTRELEIEKSELKAMVERKRRNDFVRKREFDMLRKVRREGLTPEQLATLGGSSQDRRLGSAPVAKRRHQGRWRCQGEDRRDRTADGGRRLRPVGAAQHRLFQCPHRTGRAGTLRAATGGDAGGMLADADSLPALPPLPDMDDEPAVRRGRPAAAPRRSRRAGPGIDNVPGPDASWLVAVGTADDARQRHEQRFRPALLGRGQRSRARPGTGRTGDCLRQCRLQSM